MNYRIHPAASDELNEAIDFYERREKGVGAKLLDAVESAIRRVLVDPESFPLTIRNARFVLVKKFPYKIVFRPVIGSIEIFAVAHSSRRADYWIERLPKDAD